MKFKRFLPLLCLLLCITTSASAALASLDDALSPLLEGRGAVTFSVAMTLQTLLPFDETRIDLFNRVLRNARLNARIDPGAEAQTTEFQLMLGETSLMEMTEQNQNGVYLLQTSLLPNRRLFSTKGSPMDALLADTEAEAAAPEAASGHKPSNVEDAFDMPAAVKELEGCYRALTDKTVLLTEKKTANYTIKDIGKGRVSYVAKLTAEQSGELLGEIRAVLSCGMDERYRAELSAITCANGFVVALYQNADGEDICVYLKGTVLYPDGDKRTLKWQWAFTPDRGTQTFTFEAARESGTRDSRDIDAKFEHKQDEMSYAWKGKTVVTLRRSSVTDASTQTLDLQGDTGDPLTCKGSVKRVTESKTGGESAGKTETTVTVDLALAAADGGAELTGAASYLKTKKNAAQLEVSLSFLPAVIAAADGTVDAAVSGAEATDAEAKTTVAPSVEISILPAATATLQLSNPTPAAGETQAESSKYLVGTAPIGLQDYAIPAEMTSISMDSSDPGVRQSLMDEAAQRLAGSLILAILDLPAEDRALLSDGMTEEDYAVFLAMLE